MVGEHLIEALPIGYTAVATDIDRQRESGSPTVRCWMQNATAAAKLAACASDVVIQVPRDACGVHELHRAREMIDLGRRLAGEQMDLLEMTGRSGGRARGKSTEIRTAVCWARCALPNRHG
jgi:predicted acylesterase/phospholipase RssA